MKEHAKRAFNLTVVLTSIGVKFLFSANIVHSKMLSSLNLERWASLSDLYGHLDVVFAMDYNEVINLQTC